MADIHDISEKREAMHSLRERLTSSVAPGGSGPHDPGMETRVAVLEAQSERTSSTIQRMEPKLDKLDDRVRSLEIAVGKVDGKLDLLVAKVPSWWQPPVGVAVIVAVLGGLIGLLKAVGVLH